MGKKIIIDCDTGIDDAQAIMVALSTPDVDVLAITCVNGNTHIDNVCRNTLRVIDICKKSQVPVYRGCVTRLAGEHYGEPLFAHHVHGKDGLGDVKDSQAVDMARIQKEHASLAIIRLANQYPGEITLVAMAPLTNLAVAKRLDPGLGTKLKELVIMGGNIEGQGNTSPASEFNFRADSEAACVVLNEFSCPKTIVPWETCQRTGFSWDVVENDWIQIDTEKGRFFKDVTNFIRNFYKKLGIPFYCSCDFTAMAVAIDRSVAIETREVYATVELTGTFTTGQMICDWKNKIGKPSNVQIVMHYDSQKVQELMRNMLL